LSLTFKYVGFGYAIVTLSPSPRNKGILANNAIVLQLVSSLAAPVKEHYEGRCWQRPMALYQASNWICAASWSIMRLHAISNKIDEESRVNRMLKWSVIFLVVALIAGIFGFFGIVEAAAGIAKVLFFIFVVLFVISLFTGRRRSM
jgi:uncharacterized membrane protein YtjA (UPF0391 family)